MHYKDIRLNKKNKENNHLRVQYWPSPDTKLIHQLHFVSVSKTKTRHFFIPKLHILPLQYFFFRKKIGAANEGKQTYFYFWPNREITK